MYVSHKILLYDLTDAYYFFKVKSTVNSENKYNQNFDGVYCVCARPYPDPDPDSEGDEDDMLQCTICEDWYHSKVNRCGNVYVYITNILINQIKYFAINFSSIWNVMMVYQQILYTMKWFVQAACESTIFYGIMHQNMLVRHLKIYTVETVVALIVNSLCIFVLISFKEIRYT